jgi:hypothetical protein
MTTQTDPAGDAYALQRIIDNAAALKDYQRDCREFVAIACAERERVQPTSPIIVARDTAGRVVSPKLLEGAVWGWWHGKTCLLRPGKTRGTARPIVIAGFTDQYGVVLPGATNKYRLRLPKRLPAKARIALAQEIEKHAGKCNAHSQRIAELIDDANRAPHVARALRGCRLLTSGMRPHEHHQVTALAGQCQTTIDGKPLAWNWDVFNRELDLIRTAAQEQLTGSKAVAADEAAAVFGYCKSQVYRLVREDELKLTVQGIADYLAKHGERLKKRDQSMAKRRRMAAN